MKRTLHRSSHVGLMLSSSSPQRLKTGRRHSHARKRPPPKTPLRQPRTRALGQPRTRLRQPRVLRQPRTRTRVLRQKRPPEQERPSPIKRYCDPNSRSRFANECASSVLSPLLWLLLLCCPASSVMFNKDENLHFRNSVSTTRTFPPHHHSLRARFEGRSLPPLTIAGRPTAPRT